MYGGVCLRRGRGSRVSSGRNKKCEDCCCVMEPAKRRRVLDAAETATALSRSAFEEEPPAAFNKEHYGEDGLNGRFEASDAIEMFAGSEAGGGGRFEDAETRDIAKNASLLVDLMRDHGLREGGCCIDVGAGTGLILRLLSSAVGHDGSVMALDISQKFCDFLVRRVRREALSNVKVQRTTAKSAELPAGSASFACLLDVYHHLEYPITFMRSLREALRPDGRVLVCDFHRDPSKVKSMPPSWALDHIRADQATFRAEIEKAGFRLVASPQLPTLKENYLMVFEKSDVASASVTTDCC